MKVKIELIVEYDELSDDEPDTERVHDDLIKAFEDPDIFRGSELHEHIETITCTRVSNH